MKTENKKNITKAVAVSAWNFNLISAAIFFFFTSLRDKFKILGFFDYLHFSIIIISRFQQRKEKGAVCTIHSGAGGCFLGLVYRGSVCCIEN